MAGILANSASKTMVSGDTAPSQSVSGYVTGERITLSAVPTGDEYSWGQAVPESSAPRKSELSDETESAPTFTPDVAGLYVVTCVVDGTTSYSLTVSVVAAQGVLFPGATQYTPVADAAVPTPTIGRTLYYSSDASDIVTKDDEGVVTPMGAAGGVVAVTGTPPIVSSGGTAPAISITAATTGAAGSMSASDKAKLDALTRSPQYYYDESTGYTNSSASVASPATILRQNAGAALGFTIASADYARYAYVEMQGGIRQPNGGDGSFTHWWPVITVSPGGAVTEGGHLSELLDGNQRVFPVSGKWRFSLASGESAVVSFRWGSLFGSLGPAVDPDSTDYPARWQVSAVVVPQ